MNWRVVENCFQLVTKKKTVTSTLWEDQKRKRWNVVGVESEVTVQKITTWKTEYEIVWEFYYTTIVSDLLRTRLTECIW